MLIGGLSLARDTARQGRGMLAERLQLPPRSTREA